MNRVVLNDLWEKSWKDSYPYDLLEIYGEIKSNMGYAYAYENRKNETLALIECCAKHGDSILDVAAAQGNFSLLLAEMGYKVTWNDIRTELVDYVKMKYEKDVLNLKAAMCLNVIFIIFLMLFLLRKLLNIWHIRMSFLSIYQNC
jgi:2-polyprenyl-3-methyl-5-hydroxy-6-metoxy-1,4-benzoquinol methylase